MEIIFELLLDLIVEGSIEITSNKKINKIIRYPLLIFIILFFITIIGGILLLGIVILKQNIILGIILILLSILLLVGSIIKFKSLYLKKT